ncbi:FecR family protein [Spirosoma fluviale]|uniref:FecR family protein n=1 Tax=Spirosoma fluviale TaxID=1597977 RepID=A0A286GS58_9BACT|nr:FecR domain-containing protein [Spirosoma fluviale]SOD98405.1 FecR family protein [Spirosoma fluviale]
MNVVDKNLLFAYFANATTPLQKRLIEEWLQVPDNQEQFYAWLVEWEYRHPSYQPDAETPLRQFVQHMETSLPEASDEQVVADENVPVSSPFQIQYGWLAAASVAVLLLVGWFNRDAVRYQTYQTAFGETRTVQLVDGSFVTLNANSALRVPRFGFGSGLRQVWLTGEAYFSVRHQLDNQRFVVQTTRGFDVVVHGTEFTVSTFAHRARVMLRTGKVQVNYAAGASRKQLMLRPGDLIKLDQPAKPRLQHHVDPQAFVAFANHRFSFDNMTLAEFGQLLTDTYGLRVEIPDPVVARRTLVGTFRADSADELLLIVSELFDLDVARQGNTVRLTERD